MRISAKGRYALAATTCMAQSYETGQYITVISISDKLGISKIYLEQVFSLLKRASLVSSVKGAQGGYQLTRRPDQITALDVLSAVELSLFENAQDAALPKALEIEAAMRLCVFAVLDDAIRTTLEKILLYDLVNEAEKQATGEGFMFYI